jgi:hypothetical protein
LNSTKFLLELNRFSFREGSCALFAVTAHMLCFARGAGGGRAVAVMRGGGQTKTS